MKSSRAFLVLLFALQSYVHAQNSTTILQKAMKELPECALKCMVSAITTSSCEMSDFYCISQNKELNNQMSICVHQTCTIREALTAKNFSTTAYGYEVRDHTRLVSYIGIIGGGFAALAIILRILARVPWLGGTWGPDDWAMLVTLIPVIPLTALSVPLAHDGLGRDIWTVPFDNITRILHIYYFDELFYLSSIALTKISILLFYLRIFPNKSFRRWVHGTLAVCVLYILGFVPATAMQCFPTKMAWERWDGEHHGHCFNLNVEGWITAAVNIILDVTILALPLRELSKLAMNKRKKAGIMLMFIGGGFVTIISILRLKWMIQFANSENITWDYTPIGYWSTMEVHLGIIFACLPAIRSLQYRLFPSANTPSYYAGPSGAYGFNSKPGSGFQSFKKFRSTGDDARSGNGHHSSQTSMLRSRDRSKSDKEFIHLEEYEVVLSDHAPDIEKADAVRRGQNNTQISRGSIHSNSSETAVFPIQRPEPVVTALSHPSNSNSHSLSHNMGLSGIAVRKDYSVTVEIEPDLRSGNRKASPRSSDEEVWGQETRGRERLMGRKKSFTLRKAGG